MASQEIYQLKVTLKGTRPQIWRRLQVPADTTLGWLHVVLQIAFDWADAHLHEFVVGRTRYDPDGEGFGGSVDEDTVRLGDLVKLKRRFSYMYDFGDSWGHEILVEKVLPVEPGGRVSAVPCRQARCAAGGQRGCLGLPGQARSARRSGGRGA